MLGCFTSFAQHGHGDEENEKPLIKHTAPHGGEVIDAGKYKLEIMISPMSVDEKLIVYILKKSYKEIKPEELSGYVVMRFKDGKVDTVNLVSDKGKLYSNIINVSSKANMLFYLNINKKDVSGVYFNNGIIKN